MAGWLVTAEHHGDATPGAGVRIAVSDPARLREELLANPAYPLRPGLHEEPWGVEFTVPDPFGNRLTFHSVDSGHPAMVV